MSKKMCKMNFLKTIILLVVFFIASCPYAIGSVGTGNDKDVNYEMHYPIVYTGDSVAEKKINTDLYQYIEKFRRDYHGGKFINGNFTYEVRFEDDNYISLILHDYRWTGGAHGHTSYIGLVYNKRDGEKLPLRYFIHLTDADFVTIFDFPLYNRKNELLNLKAKFSYKDCPHKIPNNYFLKGNGIVALIFQPYQRAAHAEEMTYTPIEPKWIDYFNRKNP